MRLPKRYEKPLIVLIAILLPLLIYRANAARPADANLLDRFVLLLTSPLERLLSGAVSFASDSYDTYVDVVGSRRENVALRGRLMEAERDKDRLAVLEQQNTELRRLLDLSERNPELNFVPAHVIGAGSSPLSRTVDIDKGALAGVRRGAAVISGQGLVGTVRRVGWTSAEVLLIADEKVSFRAIIARTRARGRVRGAGLEPRFSLELGEVLRSDDIAIGDRVETSGLDGVFPKGLPVGLIVSVKDDPAATHRAAVVEPYVDFARLEALSVVIKSEAPAELVTPDPLLPASLRAGWDAGVPLDAGPATAVAVEPDAGVRDAGSKRPSKDAGAEGRPDGGSSKDAGGIADAGGRDVLLIPLELDPEPDAPIPTEPGPEVAPEPPPPPPPAPPPPAPPPAVVDRDAGVP